MERVRLFCDELGSGKTGFMISKLPELLGDIGEAIFWFAPTIELAEEAADRMAEFPELRPTVLRGRGQLNPDKYLSDDPALMCAKFELLETSESAREDSKSMCGNQTKEPRCSRRVGPLQCPYWAQRPAAQAANVICLAHASLFTTPPMGWQALPTPCAVVVDEEPVINAALTAERRFMGQSFPVGLTSDDLKLVARVVEKRVKRPAERGIELLRKKHKDLELSIMICDNLSLIRDADFTMTVLRKMAHWLRHRSDDSLVQADDLKNWDIGSLLFLRMVKTTIKKAIWPILTPDDWEKTSKMDEAAAGKHQLWQTVDLFERAFEPFLRQTDEGGVWGMDVEIVPETGREDGSENYVPYLRFVTRKKLLKKYHDLPTFLLDGTADEDFYQTIWPDVERAQRVTAPYTGRILWINDKSFSRSAVLKGKELTPLGEDVRIFAKFVSGLMKTVLITHKAAHLQMAGDTKAEPDYFGHLRGVDKYNGYPVTMVVGKQTPPLRATERTVEALMRKSVDRAKHKTNRGPQWDMQQGICCGRRFTMARHKDPMVTKFVDQVSTAGQCQAAHRTRPLRNDVDVFVFGPELQWAPEESCIDYEWDEVRPRLIDRMIAEKGIAFTGTTAMQHFDWLTTSAVNKRLRAEVAEGSFLTDWADMQDGYEIVRGTALAGNVRKRKVSFIAICKTGAEPDFAAVGLSKPTIWERPEGAID